MSSPSSLLLPENGDRLADQDARLGYALGVGCAAGEQAGQRPHRRSQCADRRHRSFSSSIRKIGR